MHKWWILRQALPPVLLLAGAVASLVYGAVYHSVPVERNVLEVQTVEEEHEEEIALPFAAPPDSLLPNPQAPIPDPFFPGPPRGKIKVMVTQPVEKKVIKPVVENEPEAMIVFEVTRGGVVRLAESGMLKRTYGPTLSGEDIPPPLLCPT
jgi:hypothetical protein